IAEKIRGRAAWRAYEAEAKRRGVKLEFTDYLPPKVPDADNFASIPIFDTAFRAADKGKKIPDPFKLSDVSSKLPKFSDALKQERIDLVAWQKFFVESKMLPGASDNAAADVLKALDRFVEPLAQLHVAGT